MAEYWQKGAECRGYHELFFNGLFVVLYDGGLGHTAVGILESVKNYCDYHFERPYIVGDEDPNYYDLIALEPGIVDEISYAFFPNKRNAETTPAKNGKKQRSNKYAK